MIGQKSIINQGNMDIYRGIYKIKKNAPNSKALGYWCLPYRLELQKNFVNNCVSDDGTIMKDLTTFIYENIEKKLVFIRQ